MRIGTAVVALLLVASATARAQNSRWADPYRNGVKAFEGGRCAEAVPLFERAVAVDPRAQANKLIEGVFRTDYFPYYYLALCYVEMQQWDRAAPNLDKARSTLTRQQQAKFTDAETKIKVALAPKADPRKAAFDAAAAQAESALSVRQFDQAIKQLDQLRTSYAAEYSSAGLAAKRDEAVKGYADQLFAEGRALVGSQKYGDAKTKFQLADQTLPGQKAVADALADLKKREDAYQQQKTAAQTAFDQASRAGGAEQKARLYTAARDSLEQAKASHPEQFAAEKLDARLADVVAGLAAANRSRNANNPTASTLQNPDPKVEGARLARSAKDFIAQGKYQDAENTYASVLKLDPANQEALDAVARANRFKTLRDRSAQLSASKKTTAAQQALMEARGIDPERFTREGLAATLEKLTPASADPSRTALQHGLMALLSGRAQESIAILEPAVSRGDRSPSLHAYLGVAYATQALTAAKPDERSRLEQKAVDQFKQAKAAQPDYQLSARVVSPAIIKIYEAAQR